MKTTASLSYTKIVLGNQLFTQYSYHQHNHQQHARRSLVSIIGERTTGFLKFLDKKFMHYGAKSSEFWRKD